jgi:hypothetical protein
VAVPDVVVLQGMPDVVQRRAHRPPLDVHTERNWCYAISTLAPNHELPT